ncbi:hypothetical protein ACWDLG_35535 [Nonomuraea sp. NPDC003727]
MDRVLISGISGSGKTTLAVALATALKLPRFELDALHHGPGWVRWPDFGSDVEAFSAGPRWVTDDQYHAALGDLLWQRADTAIWLDLPRPAIMRRVVRRSIIRAVTRRELMMITHAPAPSAARAPVARTLRRTAGSFMRSRR